MIGIGTCTYAIIAIFTRTFYARGDRTPQHLPRPPTTHTASPLISYSSASAGYSIHLYTSPFLYNMPYDFIGVLRIITIVITYYFVLYLFVFSWRSSVFYYFVSPCTSIEKLYAATSKNLYFNFILFLCKIFF